MRDISKPHLLATSRNRFIKFLKYRNEFCKETPPCPINIGCGKSHLFFPYLIHGRIGYFLLQQRIPLHQRFVVANQLIEIGLVELRNDQIEKSPTFLTASLYQFRIGRRNHNQRNQSYMIGQAAILFLVPLEYFFLPAFHSAINLLAHIVIGIKTL